MKSLFLITFLLISNNTFANEMCTASWYGPGFQGKKTASGKPFNTNSSVAAHKRLPFGTKVLVKNLSNGKSTKVIILDRGPFVKGRCIDLSQAAKSAIGMGGTAPVSLEILN